MAVALSLTIPSSPAIGLLTYVPLGGDGWTAPHSVWELSVALDGDGTGGNNVIDVSFDTRFQSICTYMRMRMDSADVVIECLLELLQTHNQPSLSAFSNAIPVESFPSGNACTMTWCPPPIPGMRRARGTIPNNTGDTQLLQMYLYNFDINVLQRVPLNLILASLPRGESYQPNTTAP